MGIDKLALKSFLKEAKKQPFKGKVLALGKQDVYFTYKELKEIANEYSYPLVSLKQEELSLKEDLKKEKYITDSFLFRSLGFSEYKSVDYSDYESADFIFDLNKSNLPKNLINQFDAIFDCGTIEHVFNLSNALNNIFSMLKISGRIFHYSPSINYIDHGFYMFSPTFFYDYYTENNFEINSINLIKHSYAMNTCWNSSTYIPGSICCFNFKPSSEHLYIIQCIATKKQNSTGDKVPQQFCYKNQIWNKNENQNLPQINMEDEEMVIKRKFKIKDLKTLIKKIVKKILRA